MRWIFLTLFMANVAYFAHGWYEKGLLAPARFEQVTPAVKKGARIHLLSEVGPIQDVAPISADTTELEELAELAPAGAEVEQKASPDEAVSPAVCISIGPFNAPVTAENLRQRLLVLGVDSRVDEVQVAKAPDYWIYLPPFVGREDALREVRRLHQAGLDSYVIGEGELANGVSLGLFSKQASANKVRRDADRLGYRAQVKVVERFDLRYWVVLAPGRQGDLSEQVWNSLNDRFAFAERREQVCGSADTIVDQSASVQE